MSNYIRVLPRDLFNEANLLKCYGALWIALDNLSGHSASFDQEDADTFDIVQNSDSGGLTVRNITVSVRGHRMHLERPLNSRAAYPLYVTAYDGAGDDFEEISVFEEDGSLSPDMLKFITADNGTDEPEPETCRHCGEEMGDGPICPSCHRSN